MPSFPLSLKRIAPTWAASPLRRVFQTVCLLAFLILFFYVCYPYTAQPARQWPGWRPDEVNGQSGARDGHAR